MSTKFGSNGFISFKSGFRLNEVKPPSIGGTSFGHQGSELKQNPLTVLGHELSHFKQNILDGVFTADSPEKFVINPENPFFETTNENTGATEFEANGIFEGEIYAVKMENIIRSELELPLRTHYKGVNVFNTQASLGKKSFGDRRKFNFPVNSSVKTDFSYYFMKNKKVTPLISFLFLDVKESDSRSMSSEWFNKPKKYGNNGGTTTLEKIDP